MDAPCKVLTSSNFATMSTNGTLQTVEYKMSSCSKSQMDPDYQCNQSHSITSTGSSNHTELLRAYEFGKRLRESVLTSANKIGTATSPSDAAAAASSNRQTLRVQTHDHQVNNSSVYYEPSNVTSIATEDDDITDPPTDPGIRRFTKSPPKPNEHRISGCYNRLYRENDELTLNTQGKHIRARRSTVNTIDVNEDSTDDGAIDHEDENDEDDQINLPEEDIHAAEFMKDDDDSDQSILTASPALSEEVRSNASNVSSLVTPTNDLLEENEDDDDDEDEDEDDEEGEDDEHSRRQMNVGDKCNQDVTSISENQDDEHDPSEGRKAIRSSSFVSPTKGKKSIISRSTHWSVRSNAAYLSNDTNAIKSSVKVSHCKPSDALSSSPLSSSSSSASAYHRAKNNNRTSHNRGTSSDVGASSSPPTANVSRSAFHDRPINGTSVNSQLANISHFTSAAQHRKQGSTASGLVITSSTSSTSSANASASASSSSGLKRPPQRTKSTTDEIEC